MAAEQTAVQLPEGVFVLTQTLLVFLLVAFFGLGFALASWMTYPRHMVKKMVLALMRKNPRPTAFISRDGYLHFDISPKRPIKQVDTDGGKYGFMNYGQPLNLFGMGQGHIFYEPCNQPLAAGVEQLDRQMAKRAKEEAQNDLPIELGFRGISTDWMASAWDAWCNWAAKEGEARSRKATRLGTWLILGVSFITLALVAMLVLKYYGVILPALEHILNQIGGGGAAAGAQGGQYGIK